MPHVPPARPGSSTDVRAGRHAGEVAVTVRSGMVESRHLGHGVLVDPDGAIVASVGDPTTTFLPRSALKPWQAATVRRTGAQHAGAALDGAALAITAGSHAGTPAHLDLVRGMLAGGGLGPDVLRCPAVLPGDEDARRATVRQGGQPTPLAYNCSGKHAGMLLACVANGWPTDTYLDPDHPLQLAVRDDLEQDLGEAVAHVAVDGCGAPAFGVRLEALARAAAGFWTGDEDQRAVAEAMHAHRWAVAGTGRDDTVVMEVLDAVLAKAGADGVQLLATRTGWAVVVKVLDGSGRAAMPAALALLSLVPDLDVGPVVAATREAVLGGGREVGAVLPGGDVPSVA